MENAAPGVTGRTIIQQDRNILGRRRLQAKFPICRRRVQMAYSPEVARPNEHRNPPQVSAVAPADDIRTIMLNQVSWGAVFAGATIALVMQIVLNMVGVGVGLSTVDVAAGDTPSAGSLSVGAGIWWVISGIVAAAGGGYIAGRLSGKASQRSEERRGGKECR